MTTFGLGKGCNTFKKKAAEEAKIVFYFIYFLEL